jgi:hypothetical protein
VTTHRLLFVRRGDFPSPTVNRLGRSPLRDAHRGHRHALGANGDPLRDPGVSPVNAGFPLSWKKRTWITIIDLLKVGLIGSGNTVTNIHLSIGVTRNPRVTR